MAANGRLNSLKKNEVLLLLLAATLLFKGVNVYYEDRSLEVRKLKVTDTHQTSKKRKNKASSKALPFLKILPSQAEEKVAAISDTLFKDSWAESSVDYSLTNANGENKQVDKLIEKLAAIHFKKHLSVNAIVDDGAIINGSIYQEGSEYRSDYRGQNGKVYRARISKITSSTVAFEVGSIEFKVVM